MLTFIDEKDTEHSALVAYSMTNAVNGELSVKGTIYTNDKVLHGIDRGWSFRLDDEYYRITYAKPNDTGRQIEVGFDAVHQFFYDMSKSMVYDTLNGSKPFETYLQAIFSGSGYTYNLETTVGSIRKENFGNKSRLALFYDIIKAAGLEFSVRGRVVRILKQIGTDLSAIVRKDFNMNELKIEKNINSFVTYQRGLGAWKDDEDHSKGRYESEYESPLSKIYGRIEAEPVVDERYKETGKLLKRLKENVDKSYKVSVEIDMEDLSHAGYRLSRPNPGDYIMAINETLGFSQKVRIVSFTSEYDVGGNLISRKVVCNDIGTVQRLTNEISSLVRSNQDIAAESAKAIDTATRALISADGKNTIYFGESKPKDEPIGTFRKGDQLYLKEGEETRLYFWNGAEWELNPLGIDLEKFKEEFDAEVEKITKSLSDQDKKAEEALKASGANTSVLAEVKQTLQQFDTDFVNIRKNLEVNKKSVEDNLKGLTRRFEELNTNRNYVLNSGNTTIAKQLDLSSDLIKDLNQERTFTMSVEVEGHDIGPNLANNRKRYGFATIMTFTDDTMWYPEVWETADSSRKRILKTWTIPAGKTIKSVRAVLINDTDKANTVVVKPKLELGNQMTPWRETAESFAEAKLAEYAQTVDGRFTRLANQYADKIEFQKVQETSKLYERVLGSTENDLSTKVSRMVMSNQIFQTEISRFSRRNLLKGTRALARYNPASEYNGYKVARSVAGPTGYRDTYSEQMTITATGTEYIGLFWARASQNNYPIYCYFYNPGTTTNVTTSTGYRASTGDGFCELRIGTEWKLYWVKWSQTSTNAPKNVIFGRHGPWRGGTADAWIEICAPALFEGHIVSDHVDAPEDMLDPLNDLSTKMTQMAGSWSIKNLNSNNDIVSQINATGSNVRIQGESIHLNGKTLIDKAVIDGAAIKNMTADKITGGELNFANIKAINFDAKNVTSGIFTGLTFRGGRVVSLNGEVDIDLQRGHFNINTDNAAVRRVKEGYSSQFIKMITGTYIGEYGTNKTSLTIIGSNSDRSEDTEGGGFAGYRLWNAHNPKVAQTFPGKTNESFGELVSDRLVIRSNKKNYSNWLFHNNVPGNETYFMPMNENGMKHVLGRGDKLFESIYVRNVYTGGNYSLNQQVWDLLTCFGQLRRTGWQFTSHVINHISNILNLYGA